MSWLIETVLDEGRNAPDHPDSIGMKNKFDYILKKQYPEQTLKNREHLKLSNRNAIKKGSYDYNGDETEPNEEYANSELQKKSEEHSRKAGEIVDKFKFDGSEEDAKNKKEFDKHYTKADDYLRAADAKDRHDRRHPEKKAVNEALEMIL